MVQDIQTAWLYARCLQGQTATAYHTVFVARSSEEDRNGREVLAQIALSYLTVRILIVDEDIVTTDGAKALVKSYTPPFGPDVVFSDYKYNSVYAKCIAVTFELTVEAAAAYAVGTVFVF